MIERHQLRISLAAALLFPFLVPAWTQTTTEPKLHHRGDPDPQDRPIVIKRALRNAQIPEEASGEYLLGRPGEVVEITLQYGELSGYISRLGDGYSDDGTPLTFFFDQASVRGREIAFTTRQVHGIWYSFAGTIVRGTGKTPAEEGYYLLTGELIAHDATSQSESRQMVSLKSGRQLG